MRKTFLALAVALLVVALPAWGQLPARTAPVVRLDGRPSALVYPVLYRPAAPPPEADGPSAFLALLNDARARLGRPSLAWDATLAAYAATNAGVHMPGSSGGAAQCWAGCRSYRQAFALWAASPAHWAILINARSSIGVSTCPTGITANAR